MVNTGLKWAGLPLQKETQAVAPDDSETAPLKDSRESMSARYSLRKPENFENFGVDTFTKLVQMEETLCKDPITGELRICATVPDAH